VTIRVPSAITSPTATASPNRRAFCCGAASLLISGPTLLDSSPAMGQATTSSPSASSRPDVAAIDHDRILAAADRYLTQAPTPLTGLPCTRSPGTAHDYYSEAAPPDPASDASSATEAATPPAPFMAHRDALFQLGLAVPALAGAHLLTGDHRYAEHAALHLRAWFVDPATKMTPAVNFGQVLPKPAGAHAIVQNDASGEAPAVIGRPEGILDTLPLVEIAQAIPFLASSSALSDADIAALHAWFAAYLHWLTAPEDSGPRLPALARDRKDHHATSWLLQASAYANLAVPQGDAPRSEDTTLSELRHRFKTVTLRAQIAANGTFPHELGSATPYRDSLFNLDMMAGVCQLLSTRFESVWDYQLEDGPSMRSAIAYHFPFIADRAIWPFRADAQHFGELPARRSSLLFAARAYQRAEYASLWKTLPPDPANPDILRTLPVHQPLLWVRQPPRAA
jgi:Alginate lyase